METALCFATGVATGAVVAGVSELRKIYKKYSAIVNDQPVLRYAKTPKILKHATDWKTDQLKMVGYVLGEEDEQFATSESILFIQDFLSKRCSDGNYRVPKNALAVSFNEQGFDVGKSCQEFTPKNYEVPSDAFYSYQMLSTHSQATFYNENGIAHLAGICFYLTPITKRDHFLYQEDQVIRFNLLIAEPFPVQDRNQWYKFKNFKVYSRHCESAGKRVLLQINDDGVVEHYGYNHFKKIKKVFTYCEECAKEYKNYKFVPNTVPEIEKKEGPVVKEEEKEEIVKKVEEKKEEPEDPEFDFCKDGLDAISIN